MRTSDLKPLDAGLSEKEAKGALKLEKNLSMSGNVLCSNNIPNILLQASIRGSTFWNALSPLTYENFNPRLK
jgi:hypothetical protein